MIKLICDICESEIKNERYTKLSFVDIAPPEDARVCTDFNQDLCYTCYELFKASLKQLKKECLEAQILEIQKRIKK